MLRLAGRAGLSKGGRQVDNWFCESGTAKNCLNRYANLSKAHLSQS
jgi:hypothetical protein